MNPTTQRQTGTPRGPDPEVASAIQRGNVVVFLDIVLGADDKGNGGNELGRIKIELFVKECPKTCENFRQLCTGQHTRNGQPVGYKYSTFHRVIKDFMIQGGDFLNNDGTGKTSIYYDNKGFDDENLSLKHDSPGILSMANSGPNTNGCQFFITCEPGPSLDGNYVAFGKVISDGLLVVRKIENIPTSGTTNRPKVPVT